MLYLSVRETRLYALTDTGLFRTTHGLFPQGGYMKCTTHCTGCQHHLKSGSDGFSKTALLACLLRHSPFRLRLMLAELLLERLTRRTATNEPAVIFSCRLHE